MAVYTPGHEVHHIQARQALEPDGGAEAAKLVAVDGNDFVVVRQGGSRRRYWSAHASEASAQLSGAIRLWGDDSVLVFVNETKNLLALPVGPPDVPPPRRLAFIYGVAKLEDGAAVSVPLDNEGFEALLFSIQLPSEPATSARETQTTNGEGASE